MTSDWTKAIPVLPLGISIPVILDWSDREKWEDSIARKWRGYPRGHGTKAITVGDAGWMPRWWQIFLNGETGLIKRGCFPDECLRVDLSHPTGMGYALRLAATADPTRVPAEWLETWASGKANSWHQIQLCEVLKELYPLDPL